MHAAQNSALYVTAPSLFRRETIPYIIVSPRYVATSAGIRALHLLCHSLNMVGQRAFMAIYPPLLYGDRRPATCADLCTPVLTPRELALFERQGRQPMVIYPESVSGNPLEASSVVRWLLNYPGLLGGDASFAAGDMLYAYSRRLCESVGIGEEKTLFLPVSDPNLFTPPPEGSARSGSCFYASKYQHYHNGALLPITQGSVEITRDLPGSPDKKAIAELFRRSEIFYTYEDTALAIEAGLCGCPTVFIPNDYLTRPLGFDDLGMDGFAWGDAPEEIARAKATVGRRRASYDALIARYWSQLERFVAESQSEVARQRAGKAAPAPINLPTRLMQQLTLGTLKRYGYVACNYAAVFLRYVRSEGLHSTMARARRYMARL